jgi:hypothetical protein
VAFFELASSPNMWPRNTYLLGEGHPGTLKPTEKKGVFVIVFKYLGQSQEGLTFPWVLLILIIRDNPGGDEK